MPEITVIILTFNSLGYIALCLDSVFSQDYGNLEVIIVDNGSKDGTPGFIKKNYPAAILIENKENLGAARARNQGVAAAKAKWIMTLDCDAILNKDFFKKIIKFIPGLERPIGMIQPKILKIDKKTIYSCGIGLSKLMRFYDIGLGQIDNGKFNISRLILGPCSAAALYKKEMLEEIKEDTGYFDERFFFIAEDADLAWRAQRRGWKALFYPEAVCRHYGNSSSLDKPLRQLQSWRNRKLLLNKYRIGKLRLFPASLFYDYPRLIYLFMTNRYVRREILCRKNGLTVTYGKNIKDEP